jgi:hypothetical protein
LLFAKNRAAFSMEVAEQIVSWQRIAQQCVPVRNCCFDAEKKGENRLPSLKLQ